MRNVDTLRRILRFDSQAALTHSRLKDGVASLAYGASSADIQTCSIGPGCWCGAGRAFISFSLTSVRERSAGSGATVTVAPRRRCRVPCYRHARLPALHYGVSPLGPLFRETGRTSFHFAPIQAG